MSVETPEYSVLILTRNEADNIRLLLPQVHEVLKGQGVSYEIIIVDGASTDGTEVVSRTLGATVFQQQGQGYGAAFREGLAVCKGEWIITLDADHSHPPQFLRAMLQQREGVDCVVASRYVPGGAAKMELYRAILSRVLSEVFRRILHVPVHDLSSGYRMYRRSVLSEISLIGRDFDILIETLVQLLAKGGRVREIPFLYEPRVFGRSNARVFRFAQSYLKTLRRMWILKNSRNAADYEERAFNSIIPLQRWWQRRRVKLVLSMANKQALTLDVGSGSSRTSRSLSRLIALDTNLNPLRLLSLHGVLACQGSLLSLPFPTAIFEQVILSQVLEEFPRDLLSLAEIRRVLKVGGTLIVTTPDYSSKLWRRLEWLYLKIIADGECHRPCARYLKGEIVELLKTSGFSVEETKSIAGCEIILKSRAI